MTASTTRVLALLEILQTGGIRTVGDLARRLEVDERTVRRSVAHLIDLGIPVVSIRGRYGGYRLAPGYRMPPLMLTDDEALAVLLGLLAGQQTNQFRTSAVSSQSASAKIRRVVPDAVTRRLGALLETASFAANTNSPNDTNTEILLDIAEAARRRHPVAISYVDRVGRGSERTVHPYGVVAQAGRWYVIGADSASDDIRTFRLDRITTLVEMEGSFDVPTGFDAHSAVLATLENTPRKHLVSLRIRGSAETIRRNFPTGIASLTELPDETDWVRVLLRSERLDWVAAALAGLDKPFVIDDPPSLREHVLALADRLRSHADLNRGNGIKSPASTDQQ